MSIVFQVPEIENLVQQRLQLNQWDTTSLAQFIRYHVDGEFDDDGITEKTAELNLNLCDAFQRYSNYITQEDIHQELSKVFAHERDWLAHLDIALAMAKAQPSALTFNDIYNLREMAQVDKSQNTNADTTAHIRAENTKRFLQALSI